MRRVSLIATVALAVALVACGPDKPPPPVAVNYGGDLSATPSASPTAQASARSTARTATSTAPRTATTKATPRPGGTGPSPVALPWTPSPDVPVDATLSPTCFRRGGIVTLTVRTKPHAGVAYIAVYSDNGTGAPKPTGSGYGGNASGFADGNGGYTSVFTVAANAPPGPGRVDVIVGWQDKWGYAGPTFEVAGADGRC